MTDLALFWPLLSTFGTGQKITSYNTIIAGPRQSKESDGPDEMYVILLDNGRTKILADEKQRESLYCIRCGACLNACPVYKNIGGHTYASTYSGPIGAVITPKLNVLGQWKHLSHASTRKGKLKKVCAVKINLHELLLDNRHAAAEEGLAPFSEKIAWKMWKIAMLKRGWMNMANGGMKTRMVNLIGKSWSEHRGRLEFPKRSFNQQWREKHSK
jgi:L-lactate dehydrogenase complex protein LldF